MKLKPLILVFFVFSMNTVFCQNEINIDSVKIKCNYKFTCQPDSNNSTNLISENMLLLIGNKNSHFIAEKLVGRDRTIYEAFKKSMGTGELVSFRELPRPYNNYQIYKNFETNEITTYDRIYGDPFFYTENKEMFDWYLTSQQDTINGYLCQMATTFFAGREYIAWFTPEINISEGPYKFSGLPGLIIKIEDTKAHYLFELQTLTKVMDVENITLPFSSENYIEVTRDDFYKTRKHTAENLREIAKNTGFQVSEGQMELSMENAKKRNNPIELK